MSRIRRSGTAGELALRHALWAFGMRYRLSVKLPGSPDLVFTRARVAVFVDGCFWHGCPDHFVEPRTRRDFWLDKIRGNQSRDIDTRNRLEELGATVLRVWEHDDPTAAADAIEATYRSILVS